MSYDLFSRFSDSVKRQPRAIACQIRENDAYITYTYSQLHQLSLKAAAFLIQEGIAQQERAGILLENSPFWPAIYFGIMAVGAAAVPIDPKLTPDEIINLLRDSRAKILFTSQELFLSFKDLLKDLPALKKTLLYPFPEISALQPADKINTADKSEFTASLLYTSGTTASPKGVMLTHKNFCSNFESISKLRLVTAKDNIITLLPLHHSYPFMVCLILPLLCGAKITFLNSLKSEDLLKCLQETKGTILVGVPQLYHLLHKSILEKIGKPEALLSFLKIVNFARRGLGLNLNKIILKKLHQRFGTSLRFFFSGGARLEPKAARELALLGFNLLEGYGLTETSPVVTFTPPGSLKFGSVGIPIPGVEIKIHNPDPQNIGEVLIKGPNVMKGYYNKPQESQEVLQDGWFYSGDLGYIDKDGYLFLTGRSKEVIVLSSGKNIYPEEIEAHYLKTPYIKEICVLETSTEGTASLYAVVLPNLDYFRMNKEINIQGKIRWAMENLSKELPSYKRIMGFTLAKEEFPRTRLGKLKRYEIKAKYLTPQPKENPEALKAREKISLVSDKIERQVLEFLSRELKTKINLSDHLELDLGIDSLTRVELAIGLEKMFSLNLADTDMADAFTVKELIDKIRYLLKQGQTGAKVSLDSPIWGRIIQQTPKEEILNKINLQPESGDTLLTLFMLGLIQFILRIFWFLKVKGKSSLPIDKPFIICANHSSYLDGFAVAAGAGLRRGLNLFFLGYSGYFQRPLIAWAVKAARLIAIDPATNLADAMQACAYVLKNNRSLCIFPEGERSIDGQIKDFKKGAGILIKESNCLVVPCLINGSYQAWPRGKAFLKPFQPIKVVFGSPCAKEELMAAGAKYGPLDEYEAIALGIKEKVIELSAAKA